MTKTMTATELSALVPDVLDEVARGEQVEITKDGRTVARLVPPHGPTHCAGASAELPSRPFRPTSW